MTEQSHIESMHPLEIKTIRAFQFGRDLSFEKIERDTGLDPARVRRALEWLLTRSALELVSEETRRFVSLTEVGKENASAKITELRVLELAEKGVTMKELQSSDAFAPDEVGPAIGALKKSKLIRFGAGGVVEVNPDCDRQHLDKIQTLIEKYVDMGEVQFADIPIDEQSVIENLSRKRGKAKGIFRINERAFRTYRLAETGKEILQEVLSRGLSGEEISRVTPEHLKEGAWRKVHFRRYSLDLKAPYQVTGKQNPYREFLDFVKMKLLSMGFEEMVGDHIEPEFWNMDALYMPQFHSARDIHDVYFTKEPSHSKTIPEPYFTRVADAHRDGGETGSRGWGYEFNKTRSRQLVLRSQTTALSARQLHKANVPGKYFAMARCFRYDNPDATHAVDFFQVEGIVLSKDNTLKTLMGLLKMFAREVAKADEIKFVPGYFPFTEPSVEAHIKHPKLGWVEMGGAGIFRPEVTKPMGIDVPVIAWGLGVDRMAMVAMGINDIRDLFSTDLNKIRTIQSSFER